MNRIDEAKAYVERRVIDPALESQALPDKIKSKVRAAARIVSRFKRIGDLYTYIERFKGGDDTSPQSDLRALGLNTFEDIRNGFLHQFSALSADRTTIESFIVGERYSTFDILYVVSLYDARSGGMFLLGHADNPQAVVIKATLHGGTYQNEWLSEGQRLKYYLQAPGGVFDETRTINRIVAQTKGLPILTFVRNTRKEIFTYWGTFNCAGVVKEVDGSKWFDLRRDGYGEAIVRQERVNEDLVEAIRQSTAASDKELAERLATSGRVPRKVVVQTTAFVRNSDVIVAVLRRARGVCERCQKPAPFIRRTDGTPYLEVHHRKLLADGGEDTCENALAVCPNCHREMHFGIPTD